MPASRDVAKFNRRYPNRVFVHFAGWLPGFTVVGHTGRKSGRTYRTPVNLFRRDGRYIIALTYGDESDWVRNVLAGDGCEVKTRGRSVRLREPRILTDERKSWAPPQVRFMLDRIDAPQYMELSEE